MKKIISGVLITVSLLLWIEAKGYAEGELSVGESKLYSFKVKDIDGTEKSLEEFKGKVLLVVNVASKCGFTPQYKSLEALYQRYKDRGLIVLGFPANNFMGQEPGSNAQIKEFCSLKFHVTFPMFEKISVKGKDLHPLYAYLTQEAGFNGDISWNFNKFLISRNGSVIARYGSPTDPLSPALTKDLEAALG